MFAHADLETSSFGIKTCRIRPKVLRNNIMLLANQMAPNYSLVIAWQDDSTAYELLESGRGFQPGHGLVVLESQKRIMNFLVQCCELILHDIPKDSLVNELIPVQPEPPLADLEYSPQWSTSSYISAEAPYRLPARIDFRVCRLSLLPNKTLQKTTSGPCGRIQDILSVLLGIGTSISQRSYLMKMVENIHISIVRHTGPK
jgi:hypothetical protein